MTSYEMRNAPLFLRNEFPCEGKWHFPVIKKQGLPDAPVDLIAYSDVRANDLKNRHKGVHFFIDDYRFESIFTQPCRSLKRLSQYSFLLTPDYSVYADMPSWRQIESVGKSRWCGAWWQARGLIVYPSVAWGAFPTFDFCFDGIEQESIVAVGMIGCKHDRKQFMRGFDRMRERINPKAVICFGKPYQEMQGNILPVDYIQSRRMVR